MVIFAVVVGQIRLCLTAKGKDDESVYDLMMSSQTEGKSLMLNCEQGGQCFAYVFPQPASSYFLPNFFKFNIRTVSL